MQHEFRSRRRQLFIQPVLTPYSMTLLIFRWQAISLCCMSQARLYQSTINTEKLVSGCEIKTVAHESYAT